MQVYRRVSLCSREASRVTANQQSRDNKTHFLGTVLSVLHNPKYGDSSQKINNKTIKTVSLPSCAWEAGRVSSGRRRGRQLPRRRPGEAAAPRVQREPGPGGRKRRRTERRLRDPGYRDPRPGSEGRELRPPAQKGPQGPPQDISALGGAAPEGRQSRRGARGAPVGQNPPGTDPGARGDSPAHGEPEEPCQGPRNAAAHGGVPAIPPPASRRCQEPPPAPAAPHRAAQQRLGVCGLAQLAQLAVPVQQRRLLPAALAHLHGGRRHPSRCVRRSVGPSAAPLPDPAPAAL